MDLTFVKTESNKKLLVPTLVLAGLIAVDYFFFFMPSRNEPVQSQSAAGINQVQAYVLPVIQTSYIPILNSSINQPAVNAKSALVFDSKSSRILFSKNIKEPMPVASLTKVMTAVIVFENFNLADKVKITKDSLKVDDEKQTLYLDEEITVENLVKMLLVESSNDAAYALANHGAVLGLDFVALMNKKAIEIGMTDTIFLDPAGLKDEARSTAEDLLKLVDYSLKYKDMWKITKEKNITVSSADGKVLHNVDSTNKLIDSILGLSGGKTGYTERALGCMILVVDVPDYPSQIVSIVIGSNDRFGDTQKLINWTQSAYRWN